MERTYKNYAVAIRKSNRDIIMNILTFLFPFLSMVAAFAFQEVYPIGDRVMLTVDSYHQYIPFLIELRNKLVNGGSLFFTWNDGLGMEYYAAFANYASSPLNIFCVFFDAKTMPVFAALVTAVRAGLASLFMSWFLNTGDKGRRDYITTAFSCAYALCGWFCCDFWNVMWCDALVLLPLICLGLHHLFVEGRYMLYTLSLAICLISNYYTGYFICIFMVLFAPVYCICLFQTKKEPLNEGRLKFTKVLGCAGRFAFASLLAGGIAAVVMIPTYLILQSSSAVGTEFPKDYELTGNLFDFLGRFLVGANPNIRDGMANVYSGIIPVLMLPLFFAAPKESGIKLRQKIGYGILLLIMYLSFTNRMLNFIWHGFHFPNQIPYRESFIMSFLVIYIGFITIRNLKTFSVRNISAVFIGAGIFLILFEKFGSGKETYVQILITMVFIIVEAGIIHCTVTGKKSNFFYETAVAVVMAVEMLVSCCVTVAYVCKNEGFPSYDTYGKNHEIIKEYVSEQAVKPGHSIFERTELYPNNICNIQSVFDVNGLSIFTSTCREDFVTYMKNFGFHNNGINSVRSAGLTRVTATLLGIRNIVQFTKTDSVPALFEQVYKEDEAIFYDNPDALSVGYMVSDDILDYEPDPADRNVFAKTNEWIRSMGFDKDVYVPVDSYFEDLVNTSDSSASMINKRISIINANNKSEVTVTVDKATIGRDVYVYFDSGKTGTYYISRFDKDGNETKTAGISYRYYQIIPLGVFDGTPLKCKISFPTSPSGAMLFYSYELDREAYDEMVSFLGSEQLNVTEFDDRSLKGTISTAKGGTLLLTVAYNDSFRATVDGEEVECKPVQGALTALEVGPGEHEIMLCYTPSGFDIGAKITIVSLITLLGVVMIRIVLDNRRDRREKESLAPVPAETDVASDV